MWSMMFLGRCCGFASCQQEMGQGGSGDGRVEVLIDGIDGSWGGRGGEGEGDFVV